MKLINPSFEIWEQGTTMDDIWKHIARCTRVCYQSEKKDDSETEEEFVKRVILRHKPDNSEANHLAVLEHATIYFKDDSNNKHCVLDKYRDNPYSWYFKMNHNYRAYALYERKVTTNLRVLVENNWLDDLKYACTPTEYHRKRVTVSFITNIGVTREFNRHRANSMGEESTRYCNYSNEKFGNEIAIGKPSWIIQDYKKDLLDILNSKSIFDYASDINDGTYTDWGPLKYYFAAIKVTEWCYINLIRLGLKPQQARGVLPLDTKSQLVHTAFVDDWKHFFNLRAIGVSGRPHPNAEMLAKPLMEEFAKRGYINY